MPDINAMKATILDLSRQDKIKPLSPWFEDQLERRITNNQFRPDDSLMSALGYRIVNFLSRYKTQTKIDTVVLGMSGGVDSALTASLFKEAGWVVFGVTMPIRQNHEETERGIEACKVLGIKHLHKDLSDLYYAAISDLTIMDDSLGNPSLDTPHVNIRRGNIRARLRMLTLYNLASLYGGCVASTDNYSELAAGFWTLHGDVGDIAPIQSLYKSWEVPYLASMYRVPESTWRATPTDGLGISNGDEAQLGCTYLEWDLMVLAIQDELHKTNRSELDIVLAALLERTGFDQRAVDVFGAVVRRMGRNWFKRQNPVLLRSEFRQRFAALETMDSRLFVPQVMR